MHYTKTKFKLKPTALKALTAEHGPTEVKHYLARRLGCSTPAIYARLKGGFDFISAVVLCDHVLNMSYVKAFENGVMIKRLLRG
jgi:hypothetical protein